MYNTYMYSYNFAKLPGRSFSNTNPPRQPLKVFGSTLPRISLRSLKTIAKQNLA